MNLSRFEISGSPSMTGGRTNVGRQWKMEGPNRTNIELIASSLVED